MLLNVTCVCTCVCECERESERERERRSHHSGVYSTSEIVLIAACLQTHTASSPCLSRDFVPLSTWTDGKTEDIINCLYIPFDAEARNYGKGRYISDAACGVRPITMHCDSWPIRADCTCRKEGRLREAGHRGPTIMFSIWKIMCFLNIKACQHILLHQIHKIMIFKKASYDPFKHKISILERFLKDHVTKTGAMAAENVALSWLEYIQWVRKVFRPP